MAVQTPTVNRERCVAQNWPRPPSAAPFLKIRLRHRFTTFRRMGKAIHNSGSCNSQLGTLDSQLHSQLLAGKSLKWRSLSRDRHSHGACVLPTYYPAHLPPLEDSLLGYYEHDTDYAIMTDNDDDSYPPWEGFFRVCFFFLIFYLLYW